MILYNVNCKLTAVRVFVLICQQPCEHRTLPGFSETIVSLLLLCINKFVKRTW